MSMAAAILNWSKHNRIHINCVIKILNVATHTMHDYRIDRTEWARESWDSTKTMVGMK